jgi:hypothetical protein
MKLVRFFASSLLLVMINAIEAQTSPRAQPLEIFAEHAFESFRQGNFKQFYELTIFNLDEPRFKNLILQVRNDEIRNSLTKGKWSEWKTEDPQKAEEKWIKAHLNQWRKSYRRLTEINRVAIRSEAFDKIQDSAHKEGIRSLSPPFRWETAKLTDVEVLHRVSVKKNRFWIDGMEAPTLNWDSRLGHRLQFDLSTHGHPFRFSLTNDGPIVFEKGIERESQGNHDLVVDLPDVPGRLRDNLLSKYDTDGDRRLSWEESAEYSEEDKQLLRNPWSTVNLHYFCPNRKSMGNKIDFSVGKQHLKLNVLLTFAHGNPQRFYRILLRDCLQVPPHASAGAEVPWNQWVLLERPVWLGVVPMEPTSE